MTLRGKLLLLAIAALAIFGLLHLLGSPAGERLVINASNNVVISIGSERGRN